MLSFGQNPRPDMLKLDMPILVAENSISYKYTNLPTFTRDNHEMITKGVSLFGLFLPPPPPLWGMGVAN